MATISRKGFAQVEPNHLSGIVTGQIYAQLPVDQADMGNIIENGRFAKYDYATGKVNTKGAGEWMLIYNEVKLYDERKQGLKDFAMIDSDFTGGEVVDGKYQGGTMVPRLIATVVGDIFTTNAFGAYDASIGGSAGIELAKEDYVKVDSATGYLTNGTAEDAAPLFQVAKVYTMPDGQDGVKLIRIK